MFRLLADENFDNDILRGVLRRLPGLDFVRVQDVGLIGAQDPEILQWAADEGRILLTHDVATMTMFAYQRLADGLPMPGVIEVGTNVSVQQAIADILLIVEGSEPEEWACQITYLPL